MYNQGKQFDQMPWNLVWSIGDSGQPYFVQMITLGWPWPILWQGQILYMLFYSKVKDTCVSDLIFFLLKPVGHSDKRFHSDKNKSVLKEVPALAQGYIYFICFWYPGEWFRTDILWLWMCWMIINKQLKQPVKVKIRTSAHLGKNVAILPNCTGIVLYTLIG